MSLAQPEWISQSATVKIFRIPGFEFSWAGENPLNNGYCFGSEDGRLITTSIDFNSESIPQLFSETQEAINGVAFDGKIIAASTRCDVTFIETNNRNFSRFEGGSHDVITMISGGFAAPLGFGGLLRMNPAAGPFQPMSISKLENKPINFFKIACFSGTETSDLVAIASRRDGLAILQLSSSERIVDTARLFTPPTFDAIDVCSIASPEWPHAIAVLGADSTLYLCRDILGEQAPQGFAFTDLSGSAYSVLHDHGHLVILTSEDTFVLSNFATCYLKGDDQFRGFTSRKGFGKGVDITIAHQNLLIILEDGITILPISQITETATETNDRPRLSISKMANDASWSLPTNLEYATISASVS